MLPPSHTLERHSCGCTTVLKTSASLRSGAFTGVVPVLISLCGSTWAIALVIEERVRVRSCVGPAMPRYARFFEHGGLSALNANRTYPSDSSSRRRLLRVRDVKPASSWPDGAPSWKVKAPFAPFSAAFFPVGTFAALSPLSPRCKRDGSSWHQADWSTSSALAGRQHPPTDYIRLRVLRMLAGGSVSQHRSAVVVVSLARRPGGICSRLHPWSRALPQVQNV